MKTLLVGALAFRPKLLVLDEPLSGLDTLVRDEVVNGLLQQAADTTILISSHELTEIETFTTHVAFMQNGRLLLQEAIETLQSRFREVSVTLSAVKELPQPLPDGWLLPEIEGHRLRFIDVQLRERSTALPATDPALRRREDGMRAHAAARDRERAHAAAQAEPATVNLRIVGAILKKDVLSLGPIVALIALLFLADALIVRLDLLPAWTAVQHAGDPGGAGRADPVGVPTRFGRQPDRRLAVPAGAGSASCSPRNWLLVLSAVYLPRAIGTFAADLSLGFSVTEAFLDAVLLQDKLVAVPAAHPAVHRHRHADLRARLRRAVRHLHLRVRDSHAVRAAARTVEPGIREELVRLRAWNGWPRRPPGWRRSRCSPVGFWLVYWRRRLTAGARAAWCSRSASRCSSWCCRWALMPWNTTFALQQALGPGAGRGHDAHFPAQSARLLSAARRAELATDADSWPRTRRSGLTLWDDEELPDVGPNSVAFLTSIEPRGLPLDWRVKLNYVQADYSAGGAVLYSLRPAAYITDRPAVDRWRMPGCCRKSAVQQLRGTQPHDSKLTYSLTLLKPRESPRPHGRKAARVARARLLQRRGR